ncbi:FAD:protein FMN transferase [Allochromatium palmeri]|uniref:FAD:protein FMN transferase n=1 Tax=Allochromatium palmeri TaxID=231048 RepID=A0A6N8EE30_9GAMM|nr:FAD:protein FMN transferase [Allochromatium palmeri]MTW22512.1 FAD:protein FMN transferase [Allochromatium palmeri]
MGFVQFPSILFRPARSIVLLLALSLTLSACRDRAPVTLSHFAAFGGQVDLSLVAVTSEQAEQAAAHVAQDFAYLERDWSSQGEAMARVNRLLAQSEPFVPPPSIVPLVRLGQSLESRSEGLVNLGLGRLVALWGFESGAPGGSLPASERITALVEASPSMASIQIEGLTLKGTNPALSLDLEPIALSRAIDLAIEHLKDLGVRNALLQSGRELRAIGERSGQPWRIPVRRPSGSAVLAIVPLRGDEALASISEQDRAFTYRGQLYHAILDPRTGWPANGVRLVTVMSGETVQAAAAARALFIAGPAAWPRVAGRLGVQHALLVDAEGRLHMTPAMAERLELVDAEESVEIAEPEWSVSRPVEEDGRQP